MKTCKRCGESKPLEEFHRHKLTKDGRFNICKACAKLKAREYYAANQERMRELGRQKAQARRDADPAGERAKQYAARLKKKYGITKEDYDRMLEQQEGQCAICGVTSPGWPSIESGTFHVDHNHRTGEVRGLLCSTCNQGLGYFKDDPGLLSAAAAYLRARQDLPAVPGAPTSGRPEEGSDGVAGEEVIAHGD